MFYKVKIGYNSFRFFDGEEAMSFANLAFETVVNDDKKYPVEVSIELLKNDDSEED